MKIKVGINGFGRIGRGIFRAGFKDKNIEFVGINDIGDSNTMAHLLKYDSVHGQFPHDVSSEEKYLFVDGIDIPISKERDPSSIPWDDWGADGTDNAGGAEDEHESLWKRCSDGRDADEDGRDCGHV